MVCLSISLELLRVVQWRGDVNSDSDACQRTSIGNDGHDFSKKRACAAGVPLLPYRDFHPVTCCILFLFIIHNSTCTRLNVRQSKLHSMSSAPEFVYFHSIVSPKQANLQILPHSSREIPHRMIHGGFCIRAHNQRACGAVAHILANGPGALRSPFGRSRTRTGADADASPPRAKRNANWLSAN